jgi:hypothetical protein
VAYPYHERVALSYPLITTGRALVPGTRMGLRSPERPLTRGERVVVLASGLGEGRRIGTLARLESVRPAPGEGLFLGLWGESLVAVAGRSGERAVVEPVDGPGSPDAAALVAEAERALRAFHAAAAEAGEGGDIGIRLSPDPVRASHEVASHLRVSWPEIQELLEAGDAGERLRRSVMVLRRETRLLRLLMGGKGAS